jgi:GNAT superfamily N-acetyltransferase
MIDNREYSNDYNKIMEFLREILLTENKRTCWLPQKWEYTEYFVNHLSIERGGEDWHKYIRIWEEDEQIVAVCHNESDKTVFTEIRNGYEFLYPEMLDWAEENILKYKSQNNDNTISVNSLESLKYQQLELEKRGYKKADEACYQNMQITVGNEYNPSLPEGYVFVDGTQIADPAERQYAIHIGFHPDDRAKPIKAPESFLKMETAPLFRLDLNVMTQYMDGTITSACEIWVDPKTNTALFEPVATHPDHQRKGLGRQMLIEGLRRLKNIGIRTVYVESFNKDRQSFYNSAGFITYDADWSWSKKL